MSKKINISISKPCHENWKAMSITDKGRFCASCQKNVVDFTQASDRQIAATLRESDTLCGRFLKSQLNRDLIIPKEKNKFWVAASAAIITLLTIGNNKLFAQTPVNTEQTESKTDDIKPTSVVIKTITGTIIDESGMPIPGVNVKVKKSKLKVQTDIDGIFKINACVGDVLLIEYIGMKKVEAIIGKESKYKIILKEDFTNGIVVGEPD